MIQDLLEEDLLAVADSLAELSHVVTNLAIDLQQQVKKPPLNSMNFRGEKPCAYCA